MRLQTTRVFIGLLFAVWIGGMMYDHSDNHDNLNNTPKDPEFFKHEREKREAKDLRKLETFDWKECQRKGASKPGEDKNQRNAYNQEASENLSWDRLVPDIRDHS